MTRWLDEQEASAWRNFCLMQGQLFGLIERQTPAGLSGADYAVLANLSDFADHRARLTELGVQLGWEKSRLSHQITQMEQRGLVQKVRCPTDQRGWFVHMTPAGLAAIAEAAPAHVELVREHFVDLLTPVQLRTLDDICRKVLGHLPDGS